VRVQVPPRALSCIMWQEIVLTSNRADILLFAFHGYLVFSFSLRVTKRYRTVKKVATNWLQDRGGGGLVSPTRSTHYRLPRLKNFQQMRNWAN
jgi:hypothetical protein